jgi:hypothetical protein
MNKPVVNMILCVYCDKEWIVDDKFVCDSCDPKVKTDMLLTDLLQSVLALSEIGTIDTSRKHIITEAINALNSIEIKSQKI